MMMDGVGGCQAERGREYPCQEAQQNLEELWASQGMGEAV